MNETELPPIKFMVLGRPGMGKSHSLANMRNQERILVINGDKKPLPFISKMKVVSPPDPLHLLGNGPNDPNSLVNQFENSDAYDTCVVDTLSFILNQYEDQHIMTADRKDTRQKWAEYGKFARDLFNAINESKKNWIIMCHTMTQEIEETGQVLTQAFCKGSVSKVGLEAAMTCVLYVKNVPINQLKPNPLLHITEEEKEDGCKPVFQTRKDKRSRNETMKFISNVFTRDELFIDNDCQQVFDKIRAAYNQ